MNDEIKTDDIIKSLRVCAGFDACKKCIFANEDAGCGRSLMEEAADQLERLNTFDKTQSAKFLGKINALETENELLRGTSAEMNGEYDRASSDERIMQQAIETYGVQAQCDVAIEEMAELTKAIVKIRRVADDYEKTQAALDNLLEEIADVDIMVEQMKIVWGQKDVEEYRRKKLARLDRRLNNDRI